MRLIVLEEKQAEYIFSRHWELVDVCVIGYLEALDLSSAEARVTHNYHLTCLRFLANAYVTAAGKKALQD